MCDILTCHTGDTLSHMPRTVELWVEQVGSSTVTTCPLCGGSAHSSRYAIGAEFAIRSWFQRVTCDACQVGFDSPVRAELGGDGSIRFFS